MEPLTAITLLVAQYGIRQVVAALGGSPGASALAGEIFRQLSASEDRLGSHLTRIEEQIQQVLEQPYETAVKAGTRGLIDVAAARDSRARREDLMQARQRFRDAAAAARSELQHAIAERYLLLCAIALDRQDAAETALGHLNYAATTAALEVGDTLRNVPGLVESYLKDRGEARGFGKDRRRAERAEIIRQGANEAARLVMNLLSEAAAIGQALGQGQPPSISPASRERRSSWYSMPPLICNVAPNGPGPVRVGAFVVTWDRCEPTGPVRSAPPIGLTRPGGLTATGAGPYRSGLSSPRGGSAGYTRDVQVDVKIEVDPPLSRSVPLMLGWGSVRQPAAGKDALMAAFPNLYRSAFPRSLPHAIAEGGRAYHLEASVITSANADGRITENPSIHVGTFEISCWSLIPAISSRCRCRCRPVRAAVGVGHGCAWTGLNQPGFLRATGHLRR